MEKSTGFPQNTADAIRFTQIAVAYDSVDDMPRLYGLTQEGIVYCNAVDETLNKSGWRPVPMDILPAHPNRLY